jgi:hypothetical protein
VYIDAYPGLPPRAEPNHVVLHLSDGTTIWAKPDYGSADCTDYISCRSATLVLNPAWDECAPRGAFYEIAALDGAPVLDSNFWEIIEPAKKTSVYVGFACGQGFAGPDFTAVSNQTAEKACLSRASTSTSTGARVAAALALGATYFSYRAAYDRAVQCVSNELSSTTWGAKCY